MKQPNHSQKYHLYIVRLENELLKSSILTEMSVPSPKPNIADLTNENLRKQLINGKILIVAVKVTSLSKLSNRDINLLAWFPSKPTPWYPLIRTLCLFNHF